MKVKIKKYKGFEYYILSENNNRGFVVFLKKLKLSLKSNHTSKSLEMISCIYEKGNLSPKLMGYKGNEITFGIYSYWVNISKKKIESLLKEWIDWVVSQDQD